MPVNPCMVGKQGGMTDDMEQPAFSMLAQALLTAATMLPWPVCMHLCMRAVAAIATCGDASMASTKPYSAVNTDLLGSGYC